MIAAVMTMGPVRSLTVHQIAYMESVGVERAAAANVVGLAGLLTSGFFIGLGWVSDRIRPRHRLYDWRRWIVLRGRPASWLMRYCGFAVFAADAVCTLLRHWAKARAAASTTALASDVFQRQGLGLINGLSRWAGRTWARRSVPGW